MPKICGLVNYKPSSIIVESFNGLACCDQSQDKKRIVFSHLNTNGTFIGLSCQKDNITPYTIIYNNIKYTFVFDGELENSKELLLSIKEELGYSPAKENDYGAIATWAYILWGGFSPQKLLGRFAYAIYSEAVFPSAVYSPKVFLARDRLGVKPLYFSYKNNDTILFSSSAASIIDCMSECPKLDRYGLWQILFMNSYSIEGKSAFKNIYELQPGSCAFVDCRADGSFLVMQKRYFTLKHPKFYGNCIDLSLPCNTDFIEDENGYSKSIENLEECVEITEAPYFVDNFSHLKKNSTFTYKKKTCSRIGSDVFEISDKNYIKSFFPWIADPYKNIEVFKREVAMANEGFNWLHEIFLKEREQFKFDEDIATSELRIKMCLNYFYDLPNQLKFNEKICDRFGLNISYPFTDLKIFEHFYSKMPNVFRSERIYKQNTNKNSEFENELRDKLKKIFSNSEYRINYLIDRNKAENTLITESETDTLEMIYLIHIWLEKFNVEIDL